MHEVHTPAEESLSDRDLPALLASRICHDLVSPLGAIANGVELLTLAGLEPSPEMELISQSVENANARLRFFRLAFGLAGPQDIGGGEVARILAALSRAGRIIYEWAVQGDLPRNEVKAVCLLLQCLEAAMPVGGRVRVARGPGGWEIAAQGSRLKVDAAAWDAVGPLRAAPPRTSSTVQFALLAGVLDELGRSVTLVQEADRITARL